MRLGLGIGLGAKLSGGGGPDVTAPTLSSATIDATGLLLTLVFNEAVTGHDGFALDPSGANVTLTYDSGDGTNTLTFDISRAIAGDETATLDYAPGDVEDGAGNTLEAISDEAVTNLGYFSADNSAITMDSDIRSADGGVAATVVTPADIEGVQLWLGTTGASAATWPDLSGNANDAVQATGANQPAIVTGEVNGKQVRRFDGSNDFFTYTSGIPMGDFTIILAYKCPGFSSSFDTQYILGSPFLSELRLTLNSAGQFIALSKPDSTLMLASTTNTANAWHVISVTYDGTANAVAIYIDGALDDSGTSDATFPDSTRLGGASGFQFVGDIAHFAIFDRVLDDTAGERRGVEDYIGNELGITITH